MVHPDRSAHAPSAHPRGMKNGYCPLLWHTTLIEEPPSPLSSRPERTRISCHAALDRAACAPFREERRMKSDNATKFYGPTRGMKRRDCSPAVLFCEIIFDGSLPGFPASHPWTEDRAAPFRKERRLKFDNAIKSHREITQMRNEASAVAFNGFSRST